MDKVRSADGTYIAYKKTGSGPPLVLVHGGAAGDHKRWEMAGFRASLAKHFTVYTIDRRGRGESGDADEYKLEREFEDVSAVVNMIDEPVILFGHSLGAQIALEASLLTGNLHKLILYEPVFRVGDVAVYSEQIMTEMQALIDGGKSEQALMLFLKEMVGLTADEIDVFRNDASWQARVDATYTIPREEKAADEYEFNPSRFAGMKTPTLLLSGGESPQLFKEVTIAVDQALPNSRIVILEGQGHVAMNTATEIFIAEILTFIQGSSARNGS